MLEVSKITQKLIAKQLTSRASGIFGDSIFKCAENFECFVMGNSRIGNSTVR